MLRKLLLFKFSIKFFLPNKSKIIIFDKEGSDEIREYIHAHDAARLSVDMLNNPDYTNQHIILTGSERIKQSELLNMIKEIMNDEIEIKYSPKTRKGHYTYTPYSFQPSTGVKLTANPYIDMGQGLVECIKSIHEKSTTKTDA